MASAPYLSFDGFLRTAIERYWNERPNRAHFLALLFATREAWDVAFARTRVEDGGRKLFTGAAGVGALYVALRLFIGGPIGVVLTGLSLASLVALYTSNHRTIWDQQARYRRLVKVYRREHEQIRGGFVEGQYDERRRDLMIDGLLARFLDELDAAPTSDEPAR